VLGARLVLSETQSGSASEPAVVAARDGLGTVTLDAAGAEEAIWLNGASFVTVRGLRITGGAYHAIKIDPPSADVTVLDNVLFENTNAGDAGGQYSAIKGCCLAQRAVIEDNEIYETSCPSTNLQGVDCNGCKGWEVRRNRIHGIRVGTTGGTAIQFKSGSADTIIESNVIWDSLVGINYGGFGNPQQWGNETFEHLRGIVRNNVVYGCLDAGISVINNKDGKVYNNTLFDNGFTPDVRVAAENLQYRNNILDRPLNLRDGTTALESNNFVLTSPSDGSVFADAAANDFHLSAGAAPIDQGMDLAADVPLDFEGDPRPSGGGFDCGADESD
jgi:parallel beta-helix repeat protein